MDLITLKYASEFAGAALMALFDVVLIVIFLGAYWQIRRGFWLLLVGGTFAFLYANLFAAIVGLYAAAHIRLFSPGVMRVLTTLYMLLEVGGAIIWFVGMVLFVWFTLSIAHREKAP